MKGGEPELTNNNYKLEMNELIESDPEDYQPDLERSPPKQYASLADFLSDTEEMYGEREQSL